MKRIALVAASLALVAGGAVGCGGGGGGSSKTASKDDFCGALQSFEKDLSDPNLVKDPQKFVAKLKDEAKKLQDVGTPDNMPSDAKRAFQATIDDINKLPDNATLDDMSKLSNDINKSDEAALEKYLNSECPALSSGS